MKRLCFLKTSLSSILVLTLLVLLSVKGALAEEGSQNKIEEQKIEFLLERVEKSGATFIRNGDEHPAAKAKEHLEHKMNMARKMFWFFGPSKAISAREFIDKIAAKSSTSGKEYHIRTKEGKTYTTKEWLDMQLKEFPKSSQSP